MVQLNDHTSKSFTKSIYISDNPWIDRFKHLRMQLLTLRATGWAEQKKSKAKSRFIAGSGFSSWSPTSAL